MAENTSKSEKKLHTQYRPRTGMTPEQKAKYDQLETLYLWTTRFFLPSFLQILGLFDIIYAMLIKGGFSEALMEGFRTYRLLTFEFLATLEVEDYDSQEEEDDETYLDRYDDDKIITFRLRNKNRTLTYNELRLIFCLNTGTDGKFNSVKYKSDTLEFWSIISGGGRLNSASKNYSIAHPALRIMHIFFNMNFLCQGEPSKATKDSILHLWSLSPLGVGIPDWVDVFVNNCLRMVGRTGKIPMGGMITAIADFLGVPYKDLTSEAESCYFDYHALITSKMMKFKRQTPPFVWAYGNDDIAYLNLPRQGGFTWGTSALDLFAFPDNCNQARHGPQRPPNEQEDDDDAESEDHFDHQPNDDNTPSNPLDDQLVDIQRIRPQGPTPYEQFQQQYQEDLQQQPQQEHYHQQPFINQQQFQQSLESQHYQHQSSPFSTPQPNLWDADGNPNYHIPPFQAPPPPGNWWDKYWGRFKLVEDKVSYNYDVSKELNAMHMALETPHYNPLPASRHEAIDKKAVDLATLKEARKKEVKELEEAVRQSREAAERKS